MHKSNSALITETLRRIILEYNRTQTSNLMISGLVCQLIGHLRDNHRTGSLLTGRHTRTIENAMRYIQMHCHEKLNIEPLAMQHRLSPATAGQRSGNRADVSGGIGSGAGADSVYFGVGKLNMRVLSESFIEDLPKIARRNRISAAIADTRQGDR